MIELNYFKSESVKVFYMAQRVVIDVYAFNSLIIEGVKIIILDNQEISRSYVSIEASGKLIYTDNAEYVDPDNIDHSRECITEAQYILNFLSIEDWIGYSGHSKEKVTAKDLIQYIITASVLKQDSKNLV